ncbi:DTW domain-containing protein [Vibrio albus]|uniref:tRNA-uridine aminocarboxypropyltransferase n=1 Tax=Vibrio albus TaxID=2200953 RepID=A0A2U3BC41_9VIBR|nr:DTW domain-containing protein [Vibrio albus]PWI34294.1 DTW domain-containing protein [Vibrio albus]
MSQSHSTSRYCQHCGKAKKACICQWIQPVDTDVELIILQHPTEVNRSKGTEKILTLSLKNSRCLVGENFTQHVELNQLLKDKNYRYLLLYPKEGAQPLERILKEQAFEADHRPWRVILLDGTWKKAFKMYQLSVNLHAIPAVTLPESLQGNYRIRKAPGENHLSTAEAGYYLLSALDKSGDFTPLIDAFERMIDFQIAQLPEGVYQSNYLD